jgi:hypothetical protein
VCENAAVLCAADVLDARGYEILCVLEQQILQDIANRERRFGHGAMLILKSTWRAS